MNSEQYEWASINASVMDVVAALTGRSGILVRVSPQGGRGKASALYSFDESTVEINSKDAFGSWATPAMIGDLSDTENQKRWPVAMGLITHECAHARWGSEDKETLSKNLDHAEMEAYLMLEEGRIEGFAHKTFPENRDFLRAAAMKLIVSPENEATKKALENPTKATMAGLMVLIYGRVKTGVLRQHDVKRILNAIHSTLSREEREQLDEIMNRFLGKNAFHPEEHQEMMDAAKDLAKLLDELEPQSTDMSAEELAELLELLGAQVMANISEEKTMREKREQERALSIQIELDEESKNKKLDAARRVLHSDTLDKNKNYSIKTRPPKEEERAVAVRLAQQLDRARYRDREITQVRRADPPGRLRVSKAVQKTALRKSGNRTARVDMWEETKRTHVDEPRMTIGVLCDVSGSMGGAEEPAGSMSWVFSEASKRIDATYASVYFGSSVFPGVKPHEKVPHVSTVKATDETESFHLAAEAIDGMLNLSYGSGPRILAVFSDANYTNQERPKNIDFVTKVVQKGVVVLWLVPHGSSITPERRNALTKAGAQVVNLGSSLTEATELVGQVAVEALRKAGANR